MAKKQTRLRTTAGPDVSDELTVLSFGGGQDSTALLFLYYHDVAFRRAYAPNRLVAVMSDTGNEHPHTYDHVAHIDEWCASRGIPFYFLSADPRRGMTSFHTDAWATLTTQWERNRVIQTTSFSKSCTDNLKIKPIYRWLDWWLSAEYGYNPGKGLARPLYQFRAEHGKLRMLIGIAAEEEKRVQTPPDPSTAAYQTNRWYWDNIVPTYPLIDLGFNRRACQEKIASLEGPESIPYPSNCMMCPYASNVELVWLWHKFPETIEAWARHETRKIERFEEELKPRNNPVLNAKRTIKEQLAWVREKGVWRNPQTGEKKRIGEMTFAELDEIKFSHGHCVNSSY